MIRQSCGAVRWMDLLQAVAGQLVGRAGSGSHAFRAALAQDAGVSAEHWFLTGTGRAALHAFVSALGLGPDDEVLLPGYTCVVVPNVFRHLGLKVRYVDIGDGAVNPGIDQWMAAIGPRTRLLVVPHNFGVPTEGIARLRHAHPAVIVIEDAAHAWGSRFADGTPVGTHGHAAFFSFEYSKCLTTGIGGALLVNDSTWLPGVRSVLKAQHPMALAAEFKVLLTLAYHLMMATWPAPLAMTLAALARGPSRAAGLVAETPAAELRGDAQPDYLQALPDLLARVGRCQVLRGPALRQLRQRQASQYRECLSASPWLQVPALPDNAVLLRFPVRVQDAAQREHLISALAEAGIEPGLWFDDVVHPRGSLRHGYVDGACAAGEGLALTMVNLPMGLHAGLSSRQWALLRRLAAGPGPARAVPQTTC